MTAHGYDLVHTCDLVVKEIGDPRLLANLGIRYLKVLDKLGWHSLEPCDALEPGDAFIQKLLSQANVL